MTSALPHRYAALAAALTGRAHRPPGMPADLPLPAPALPTSVLEWLGGCPGGDHDCTWAQTDGGKPLTRCEVCR